MRAQEGIPGTSTILRVPSRGVPGDGWAPQAQARARPCDPLGEGMEAEKKAGGLGFHRECKRPPGFTDPCCHPWDWRSRSAAASHRTLAPPGVRQGCPERGPSYRRRAPTHPSAACLASPVGTQVLPLHTVAKCSVGTGGSHTECWQHPRPFLIPRYTSHHSQPQTPSAGTNPKARRGQTYTENTSMEKAPETK